ncbi:hypothetical protein [Sphaerisporangium fuscum]|uniref:hypothetical protein n=1 Tax=Sphaerisporangium fuscum TaxID=2835868 RepID=UPI001BDD5D99|nr:hypothetical protein [Sphaerisporangium fuscum]
MKIAAVGLSGTLAALLMLTPTTPAYADCPPDEARLKPLRSLLEGYMSELRQYRPGTDPRDLEWLKANLVDLVPPELPATKRFVKRAKPEIDRLLTACYTPADYTRKSARDAFARCAKAKSLRLMLQYSARGMEACDELDKELGDWPRFEPRVREVIRRYLEYAASRPAAG